VAGAIYSGFGMVLTLLIITRRTMGLERYITGAHLDAMAKVALLTGSIVGYAYLTELFAAWFKGDLYERYTMLNRATGPYAWCFWTMVFCNVVTPQILWSKRVRHNVKVLFAVSILINVGMWFERFVIIVTSLHRTFLPSAWGMFKPTIVDVGVLVGSFGLFFTCFLIFIRVLPMIAIWEVKELVGEQITAVAAAGRDLDEDMEVANA
jgi:molybdopterin-containing oxidoreductase family membrane subunit